GSANLSQAAKNKNFEIRAMTVGDPKAVKLVGRLLHEPLFKQMSKPVQLVSYAKPEGVPDLFRHPPSRDARIDHPNLVFISTNPIYLNDASDLWGIRAAPRGNGIVKIGWADAKLDQAARTRPRSEAVVINPGLNFAGEPRELSTELEKYYGVNQDV